SFFFSSRRRHTRSYGDWSSDVCSSDLGGPRLPWRARAGPLQVLDHRVRDRVAAVHHPVALGQVQPVRVVGPPGAEADLPDPGGRSEERRVGEAGRAWRWREAVKKNIQV